MTAIDLFIEELRMRDYRQKQLLLRCLQAILRIRAALLIMRQVVR